MKPMLKWSPPRYGGSEASVPFGLASSLRLSVSWKEGTTYSMQCDASRGEVSAQNLDEAAAKAEEWLRAKLRVALVHLGEGSA